MRTINLYPQASYPYTFVPNTFIDHYLSEANGDFIKVYLLLLRSMQKGVNAVSTTIIADDLHLTEADVKRAFSYWERKKVMGITYDASGEITAITFHESTEPTEKVASKTVPTPKKSPTLKQVQKASEQEVAPTTQQREVKLAVETKPQYNMKELTNFTIQPDYKQLIYITQKYMGKMLTQQDINTLISFNDWLGLPFEVIELLIEYCVSNNHRNMKYIEKVAISWADDGINTVAKASYRVETFNTHYFKIMKALGIGDRQPTPKQIEYMKKWLDVYALPLDIVLEACNRTMETIHQPQFTYIDAILKNWHKHRVRTKKDIEELDAKHHQKGDTKKVASNAPVSKFVNYDQRTYDFDQLEKRAMEMLIKETDSKY